MVKLLSYVFAIIITLALAIFLYPIAAFFWLLGLFGKISNILFTFTKRVISSLWRDIRDMGNSTDTVSLTDSWTCFCGTINTGKFCSECGAKKSDIIFNPEENNIQH